MIQYVGDVAIYVRPNKLDRFNQVRNEIKEAARLAASAIFTAYDESETKFFTIRSHWWGTHWGR